MYFLNELQNFNMTDSGHTDTSDNGHTDTSDNGHTDTSDNRRMASCLCYTNYHVG